MEETSAVSTRTAVMSEGQILCRGSSVDLEKRFFNYVFVVLKLVATVKHEDALGVASFVSEHTLQGSSLVEHYDRCLSFRWDREGESSGIGTAISRLLDLKNRTFGGRVLVEAFSIHHSNLDQFFLSFDHRRHAAKTSQCCHEAVDDDIATSTTADSSLFTDRLII